MRFTPFILLIVLCSFSVLAQCGDLDSNDPCPQDLANGFANDPRAWNAIVENTALLNDPTVLNAAFSEDLRRTIGIINDQPSTLSLPRVLTRFDQEVARDVQLLNENPAARHAWFSERFKIDDKGGIVEMYDGSQVTTGGDKGLTFTAIDFPGAIVNEDGSLTYDDIVFDGAKSLFILSENGMNRIKVIGGFIEYAHSDPVPHILDFENGFFTRKFANGVEVQYSGDFLYEQKKDGVHVQSTSYVEEGKWIGEPFERILIGNGINKDHHVHGTIIEPLNTDLRNLILEGRVHLETDSGAVFDIVMDDNDQVFYTEHPTRNAASFCPVNDACIVNSGQNDDYRDRLAFLNIQQDQQVSFASKSFYDTVEVIDNHGTVSYQSLSRNGKVISTITHNAGEKVKYRGFLPSTNAGRVDIMSEQCTGTECTDTLQHWSSNRFQKEEVTSYFNDKISFTSCNVGVDCLQRIARASGRVRPGRSGTPDTVIIIAGDNADTARSLESSWCREHGCYIINSRDVPPTYPGDHALPDTVENMVVTGHHYKKGDSYWRDAKGTAPNTHNPIDLLYVNPVKDTSPFNIVPSGKNLKHVRSSSCNSAFEPTLVNYATGHMISADYIERNPNLVYAGGWDGKSPVTDRISLVANQLRDEDATRVEFISPKDGSVRGIKAGVRKLDPHCKGSQCVWVYERFQKQPDGEFKITQQVINPMAR